LLHELSHMWFGNCVTFEWWEDLWFNESFANFICYFAFDSLKEILASIFTNPYIEFI